MMQRVCYYKAKGRKGFKTKVHVKHVLAQKPSTPWDEQEVVTERNNKQFDRMQGHGPDWGGKGCEQEVTEW